MLTMKEAGLHVDPPADNIDPKSFSIVQHFAHLFHMEFGQVVNPKIIIDKLAYLMEQDELRHRQMPIETLIDSITFSGSFLYFRGTLLLHTKCSFILRPQLPMDWFATRFCCCHTKSDLSV